jgi:predicted dehydrogenase
MEKQLRIGLIGCGFMGRVHSNAYRKLGNFFDFEHEIVMKAVCSNKEDEVVGFADNWGWESYETDWQKLIAREDIDMIDVCVPNNLHYDIVMAAINAGKIIACEKPFNYRGVPAVALAKILVDEGRIGRPFHYRAKYLQDWTISADVPQGGDTLWRLDSKAAGSGVTGDLLAHSIDLAMWLNGPIKSVCAMTETFIKERKMQDEPDKVLPVTIDDACAFLARFENGTLATFESTRYARGRKNQHTLEINGENGAVAFDLENFHELGFYNHGDDGRFRGWRNIQVWDSDHPYMKHWWVPGCGIGYEHTHIHTLANFVKEIETGERIVPDFKDALATQIVCEKVLSSADNQKWESIELP